MKIKQLRNQLRQAYRAHKKKKKTLNTHSSNKHQAYTHICRLYTVAVKKFRTAKKKDICSKYPAKTASN